MLPQRKYRGLSMRGSKDMKYKHANVHYIQRFRDSGMQIYLIQLNMKNT